MAYTTPATFVAGNVLTAAQLNTNVRDNVAWIATDSPACRAYNSANISHASSGVEQVVTCNSERFDNATIHSTSSNTSRLTVPSGAGGKYIFGGGLAWASSASGTYRQSIIKLNAATYIGIQTLAPSASHFSSATIAGVYALAAADYIELWGNQDSGGALNMTVNANYSPEVWMFWFRT